MTNPKFDAAFADLLKAFNRHETLRSDRADIPALSKSSHDLFKARMAMRHIYR